MSPYNFISSAPCKPLFAGFITSDNDMHLISSFVSTLPGLVRQCSGRIRKIESMKLRESDRIQYTYILQEEIPVILLIIDLSYE